MMNISPTEDSVVRQIEIIVNDGVNVISIETPRGEKFYIYSDIQHAYKGSSTSVTYNSFKGIEITPFIYVTRDILNQKAYLQALQRYLQDRQYINFKISESTPYVTYTS